MNVATNKGIEMLREEINTFRGKTHSDTYNERLSPQHTMRD
jgi:hypothetical protein